VDEKVDAAPPPTPPPSNCVGVPHPYTVFEGIVPVDGVTAKVDPVQSGPIPILDTDGVGFTKAVTVNGLPDRVNPEHAPYEGVTI
jgi:hypothetical protein